MNFTPRKFEVLTDSEFPDGIKLITNELECCKEFGTFESFDKTKLYFEYFLCENAKGNVVIVHGLSEFTKKFYEMTYYFLNSGYNVFLYDGRCHGYSERLTDDPLLIHVDKFEDYVKDLEIFIEDIVLKVSALPIYTYSHSMGGAVTVFYLKRHQGKIKRAVLSAPLFEPHIGSTPYPIAIVGTKFKCIFKGKKSVFNKNKSFNPEAAIKSATDKSQNRFMHNLNLRINEKMYQTTPMTTGWVYNSLILNKTIKKQRIAQGITTPILLFSAAKDTVVRSERHTQFAQKCAFCELITLENSGHAILQADQSTINEHINKTLYFFEG